MLRRSLGLVIALSLFAAACSSPALAPQRSKASATRVGSGRGDSPARSGGEEADTTAARLSALNAAQSAGTFGHASQGSTANAAAGWSGEQVVNPNVDDWEPA